MIYNQRRILSNNINEQARKVKTLKEYIETLEQSKLLLKKLEGIDNFDVDDNLDSFKKHLLEMEDILENENKKLKIMQEDGACNEN